MINFERITEHGWNKRPENVKFMKSAIRLDGSKSWARVVANNLDFAGKTLTIRFSGSPAADPAFDKGIWIMLTKDGHETGAELDLLELSHFNDPIDCGGWVNYRSSQYHDDGSRNDGEMYGFDPGAFEEWEVQATFLKDAVRVCVYGIVDGVRGGLPLKSVIFSDVRITTGNLKIGAFFIENKPAFKKAAHRGCMTLDITSVELK